MSDHGRDGGTGMVPGNKQLSKNKLIFVEGRDEEYFFEAMLKHLARHDVQVMAFDGKEALRTKLKVLKTDPRWPDLETLLIVRDADYVVPPVKESAAQVAWKSVTGALHAAAIPVPGAHGQLTAAPAAAEDAPAPRTAVFILPDGSSDGMLEDLCLGAVADDPVTPCLDAYFRCIEEKGRKLAHNVLPKARAHAFLASRPIPDKRVGLAAAAGYFPWDAAAFAPLIALVRGL